MLKLIIVDDERIIRESINNLIDWQSLGVEVIGLYKNGIEAYNAIIDESPDIVMTDIRMPGLSGLELIKRLYKINYSTEFIILSGYQEFSYAKEAMQYGVKHYLLKPCNEQQIIESIEVAKKDCYEKKAKLNNNATYQPWRFNLKSNMIRSMIVDGVSSSKGLDSLIEHYSAFYDFDYTTYELCYLYYIDEKEIFNWIEEIYRYINEKGNGVIVYPIYCKNVLIFMFESYQVTQTELDIFVESQIRLLDNSLTTYKRVHFNNLKQLLTELLRQLKRFETVEVYYGTTKLSTYNYQSIADKIDNYYIKISSASLEERSRITEELVKFMGTIEDRYFLQSLITNILLKRLQHASKNLNPLVVSNILMQITSTSEAAKIMDVFSNNINNIFDVGQQGKTKHKDFIEKVIQYVDDNLANPNLSLKLISENYLYMNVDYVGKQFVKETGVRFSTYLTELRIKKAKELLANNDISKVYVVAEEVGCGNNPQYFSQIFKKYTGMTPSNYIKFTHEQ